jgi:hypothetical protein
LLTRDRSDGVDEGGRLKIVMLSAGGAPSVQQLASAGSARPDHSPLSVILRMLGIRGFLMAVPAFHARAEAVLDHRRILPPPHRPWHLVLLPVQRTRPQEPGLLAIPVDSVPEALSSLPAFIPAGSEAARPSA